MLNKFFFALAPFILAYLVSGSAQAQASKAAPPKGSASKKEALPKQPAKNEAAKQVFEKMKSLETLLAKNKLTPAAHKTLPQVIAGGGEQISLEKGDSGTSAGDKSGKGPYEESVYGAVCSAVYNSMDQILVNFSQIKQLYEAQPPGWYEQVTAIFQQIYANPYYIVIHNQGANSTTWTHQTTGVSIPAWSALPTSSFGVLGANAHVILLDEMLRSISIDGNALNKHFHLCGSVAVNYTDPVKEFEFVIGSEANPFTGVFESFAMVGGVANFKLVSTSPHESGLFGALSGATVRKVSVTGSIKNQSKYAGLLAGVATNSQVDSVFCFGEVLAPASEAAGGFIGRLRTSVVKSSFSVPIASEKAIKGRKNVGGFAGVVEETVFESSGVAQSGQINGGGPAVQLSVQGIENVGGFAGFVKGNVSAPGLSVAVDHVGNHNAEETVTNVGGIIGKLEREFGQKNTSTAIAASSFSIAGSQLYLKALRVDGAAARRIGGLIGFLEKKYGQSGAGPVSASPTTGEALSNILVNQGAKLQLGHGESISVGGAIGELSITGPSNSQALTSNYQEQVVFDNSGNGIEISIGNLGAPASASAVGGLIGLIKLSNASRVLNPVLVIRNSLRWGNIECSDANATAPASFCLGIGGAIGSLQADGRSSFWIEGNRVVSSEIKMASTYSQRIGGFVGQVTSSANQVQQLLYDNRVQSVSLEGGHTLGGFVGIATSPTNLNFTTGKGLRFTFSQVSATTITAKGSMGSSPDSAGVGGFVGFISYTPVVHASVRAAINYVGADPNMILAGFAGSQLALSPLRNIYLEPSIEAPASTKVFGFAPQLVFFGSPASGGSTSVRRVISNPVKLIAASPANVFAGEAYSGIVALPTANIPASDYMAASANVMAHPDTVNCGAQACALSAVEESHLIKVENPAHFMLNQSTAVDPNSPLHPLFQALVLFAGQAALSAPHPSPQSLWNYSSGSQVGMLPDLTP